MRDSTRVKDEVTEGLRKRCLMVAQNTQGMDDASQRREISRVVYRYLKGLAEEPESGVRAVRSYNSPPGELE